MRRKRDTQREREFNSQLPVWITEPGEREGTLNLQCPRCDGKLIVSQKRITNESDGFIGRPCIYCFRTARLPEKYMDANLLKMLDIAKSPVEAEIKIRKRKRANR